MRSLFKWALLLAAPGALWAAYEMFGLTLGGPQMLFFSISHALPPLFLLVLLAVPSFAIWTLTTAISLFTSSVRSALRLTFGTNAVLLAAQLIQVLCLVAYEAWSSSPVRVVVCLLGWGAVLVWLALSLKWLFGAQQTLPAELTAPRSRG
jgi:hypothetical protein